MITNIQQDGKRLTLHGVAHDNDEIITVFVNGRPATITTQHAGVADWSITLDPSADGHYLAKATDLAGNAELKGHQVVHQVE